MLGFTETGQVGVEGGDRGTPMAEVDLNLAEVLALFEEMGGVGMAEGVNMRGLLHAAGAQGEPKGALEGGAIHRLGRGGGTLAAVAFGREEELGMPVGLPLLAQPVERALGQRDVAVGLALAAADVEEPALGIDVRHLEVQPFAEAQTAGVNGQKANALIERGDLRENRAHLSRREDDREFELAIGADELDFGGPRLPERLFPEELDRAERLRGGLAGHLLLGLEMEEVLAEFFGRDALGRLGEELAELADAGPVAQDAAFRQREKAEIVEEAV